MSDEAEETIKGAVSYLDILDRLHQALAPRLYLEIGVRHGRSLALAKGPAIGVDPAPELLVDLPETTRVVARMSDAYFRDAAEEPRPDFGFIDGMHLLDFVLRDFINFERHAVPGAVVVVDDIFPNHPAQAERERRTRAWTGDVWRLVPILARHRPDLRLLSLDASPAGLLLVTGLDPANGTLAERYESLVADLRVDEPPPVAVLERHGAIDPRSAAFESAVRKLVEARASLPG